MSAAALLSSLQSRGVELLASGDRLRWRPREALTPAEVAAPAEHKAEVLQLLADRAEAETITWICQALEEYWRLPAGSVALSREPVEGPLA
jgi:hypothetical protein